MDFAFTDRCNEYRTTLLAFMDECIYPNESVFHDQLVASGDPHHHPAVMEELKVEARKRGLWNLFLPHDEWGPGLSNLEYAPLAEIMGRSTIASEACNCSAPDTGNMEVLTMFGTPRAEGHVAAATARGSDPFGVRHDRAATSRRATPPTSRCGSSATATTTC